MAVLQQVDVMVIVCFDSVQFSMLTWRSGVGDLQVFCVTKVTVDLATVFSTETTALLDVNVMQRSEAKPRRLDPRSQSWVTVSRNREWRYAGRVPFGGLVDLVLEEMRRKR
jgi:hypothetical protein